MSKKKNFNTIGGQQTNYYHSLSVEMRGEQVKVREEIISLVDEKIDSLPHIKIKTPKLQRDSTNSKIKWGEGSPHIVVKQTFSTFAYCNLCKDYMWGLSNQGVVCTVCGYSAHSSCAESIEFPTDCRIQSIPALCGANPKDEMDTRNILGLDESKDISELHHWVEGNAQMSAPCFICCEQITTFGPEAHRCSRCRVQAHTNCLNEEENETICSPPQETLEIKNIRFYKENSTPLLIFINSRSGGQQGVTLIRKFRKHLNPNQVFDLNFQKPKEVFSLFRDHPNVRILCCGGDGTVGWILSSLDDFPNFRPDIAILPLGTGNDLARTLNWGGGYFDSKLSSILNRIETAERVYLDRWNIVTRSIQNNNKDEINTVVMNNYFSIGVDASVALAFHRLRNESPSLCSSRFINKFWYLLNGVRTMIEAIPMVDQFVSIEIDGKECWVNENIGAIICLNLPSYMGGADLWGTQESDRFHRPSINDQLLEVVAVTGTFHLVEVSINLCNGMRVGQGREIKIRFKKNLPISMQVDGEPWIQEPCEITISHRNQGVMLKATVCEDDEEEKELDFEGALF